MKQIIKQINAKWLMVFAFILILALGIWFLGPFLEIDLQYPLQSPEKRIHLIALLFLIPLVKILLTPIREAPFTTTAEGKKLLKRFNGAMQFLKKTVITRSGKSLRLAELPWYLMIGPTASGKTSLLANASINYVLTKQFKNEKIIASDTCDFWATRELILVDVPGSYLKDKTASLWNQLIYLIKKSRGTTLKGLVLALPLTELMKTSAPQEKKQFLAEIKQKMTLIEQQYNYKLPIFLLITKCDHLPGFSEFFAELSIEELAQPWGFTLPFMKENENAQEIFNQHCNALIKRINNQLITRLHQERNIHARSAIKDFPLQVERLKDVLLDFLKALSSSKFPMQGLYLTSATQTQAEEPIANIINPTAHQALQLLRPPVMPSKAFFIKQFILQALLSIPLPPSKQTLQSVWQRRAVYVLSVATVITATLLLGKDFQQSVLQTYSIQNDLTQYQISIQQTPSADHLLKILPLLDGLQNRLSHPESLSALRNFMDYYSDKSLNTARSVYTQALHGIVLPEIKNYFENYLKNPPKQNPTQVYNVLKAYLMLSDPHYLQADYVEAITRELLPPLDKQTIQSLHTHLVAALRQNVAMSLNNDLISTARAQLAGLSKQDLAYVILKSNETGENINLTANLADPQVFVNSGTQIPYIYTANAFQKIQADDLKKAAADALQGNWILGNADALSNPATIDALAEQVKAVYISDYISAWENQLNNIRLITSTGLAQIDAMVSNITSNTSPMLQVLKTIKENTSIAPVISSSPKIQALNHLLENVSNNNENVLYQIFVTMRQLHFYLENIVSSNEADSAAFDAAKSRMENPAHNPITQIHIIAEENPEPMRTWLNNLAYQSWFWVLHESSHYIESQWQLNIIPIYQSHIANRYPVDPTSSQEIDVQQFVNFAWKQGTFANFYQQFLRPFIVEQGKQPWQWRVIDNQHIPFSNSVLAQIQQSMKIQTVTKYAIFTQGANNVYVKQFQLPGKLTEAT